MDEALPDGRPWRFEYHVAPDLYRRALAHPLPGATDPRRFDPAAAGQVALLFAVFFGTAWLLGWGDPILPLTLGFVIGAGFVFLQWRRIHSRTAAMHGAYNDTGGPMALEIGASGIIATRPGIESRLAWSFVSGVRAMEGAVLFDLPSTARLILPVSELPEGTSAEAFVDEMEHLRVAGPEAGGTP